MRLLNTTTMRLKAFIGQSVPPYAILSHTWGDEEVLFGDIKDDPDTPHPTDKKGWQKIEDSCRNAAAADFQWIWIDTCCINKESSAELSEAINSMFKWYRQSKVCYAYLFDINNPEKEGIAFKDSRWFSRGWTLQELIAPPQVIFYDYYWNTLGPRQGQTYDSDGKLIESERLFQESISQITGIPLSILCRNEMGGCGLSNPGPNGFISGKSHHIQDGRCADCSHKDQFLIALNSLSIAQRMSWAAQRQTTRKEDQAYCLLGVFSVNMPLLYGEGDSAFLRLQQEIIKTSDDQSILAFHRAYSGSSERGNLFAETPKHFTNSRITTPPKTAWREESRRAQSHIMITAKTVEVELTMFPCNKQFKYPGPQRIWLGLLDCSFDDDLAVRPGIYLQEVDSQRDTFRRVFDETMEKVGPQSPWEHQYFSLYGLLEFDLRKGETRRLHLLLTSQQEDAIERTSSGCADPAVQVILPPYSECVVSYPQKFSEADYGGNGLYLPSVRLSQDDAPRHPRACGILYIKFMRGISIFILWGIKPDARGHLRSCWCKVIDAKEVLGYQKQMHIETDAQEKAAAYFAQWNRMQKTIGGLIPADHLVTEHAQKILGGYCTAKMKEDTFLGQTFFKMEVSLSSLESKEEQPRWMGLNGSKSHVGVGF